MAKQLFILRHATSSFAAATDFQRTLSVQGEEEAHQVGKWLRQAPYLIRNIMSSNALRAETTAKIVADEVAFKAPIVLSEAAYNAGTKIIFEVLNQAFEKQENTLFVGHNPALSSFIGELCGINQYRNSAIHLRPASIAVIDLMADGPLTADVGQLKIIKDCVDL